LDDALSDKDQISKILLNSPNGLDSIISKYSEVYKKLKVDFNELKMSDAIKLISENTSIVKRPIIVDLVHENLEVGYNKDDIEIFGLAATHDYKTCPLSIEECRKKTRIALFNKYLNIQGMSKDDDDNKE
jgi:regulatory protein spx